MIKADSRDKHLVNSLQAKLVQAATGIFFSGSHEINLKVIYSSEEWGWRELNWGLMCHMDGRCLRRITVLITFLCNPIIARFCLDGVRELLTRKFNNISAHPNAGFLWFITCHLFEFIKKLYFLFLYEASNVFKSPSWACINAFD